LNSGYRVTRQWLDVAVDKTHPPGMYAEHGDAICEGAADDRADSSI
jgi:hypothetical protein